MVFAVRTLLEKLEIIQNFHASRSSGVNVVTYATIKMCLVYN